MMDEKRLAEEYRKLKHQAAPELWSRIEENLQDHPEREGGPGLRPGEIQESHKVQKFHKVQGIPKTWMTRKNPRVRAASMVAAATAAAAVMMVVVPQWRNSRWNMADGGMAQEADLMAEAEPEAGAYLETGAYPEAETYPEAGADPAAGQGAGTNPDGGMAPKKGYADGVLDYGQLQLAAYQPLEVPGPAMVLPEDSQYFSEAVLGETELLCKGTVTSVSLEQDVLGRAVRVVYELKLEQVCYAEDYVVGMDTLTVKSPIVGAEGDEVFILYQLQAGGCYLLPLKKQEGDWELLYPFAPQVQVTGDGAYLFHSGYASLTNEDTILVVGNQEGQNDYYYDRMLLRRDGDFLSEFVSLVETKVREE